MNLRARVEELTGLLAEQESVLFRLEITRETMTQILSGDGRSRNPQPWRLRSPVNRITGSRWTVSGAEAVLTLGAVISNGDFPQYWVFHTHKERERLYPQPDQHNHELHA
ncbi:hypothetical protein ACWDZ6_21415 [Streptomyces sp. NPDC002926]